MRPLSAAELLTLWEQGMNQTLLQKTLHLLALACPDLDADAVSKLSIGQRDARLLLLREWLFGSRLSNMAACPQCSQPIEWETNIQDLRLQPLRQDQSPREFNLETEDFSIRFRLPDSSDIAAVFADSADRPEPDQLLTACIIESCCSGQPCQVHDLPEKVVKAINRRMEEEDPQANVRMALKCPNCSHQWDARFDIASYLWTEIHHWAQRMLVDIHKLASTYGWSEHHILAMSPVRRQLYTQMVG